MEPFIQCLAASSKLSKEAPGSSDSCARCGDGDGAAHDLVEHGPPERARLEDVERCKVALDQRLQGPGGKESMYKFLDLSTVTPRGLCKSTPQALRARLIHNLHLQVRSLKGHKSHVKDSIRPPILPGPSPAA